MLFHVIPIQTQTYGDTFKYHPPHVDFQALTVPTCNLNQLQVHLGNGGNVGIPFYWVCSDSCCTFTKTLLYRQVCDFKADNAGPWKSMHNWSCFPRTCPPIFECISRRCDSWTKHGKWDCSSSCCCKPGAIC